MNLNEQQKVILYLIKNIKPSRIKRTLIFKLLFLADWEFFCIYGEKITNYEYCNYNYGPFCPAIYSDLEGLELQKIISSEKSLLINYVECRYKLENGVDITIPNIKMKFLDEIIKLGNKLSLSEILDLVYSLPVVKNTDKNSEIDFSKESIKFSGNIENIDKYKKIIKKLDLKNKDNIPQKYSEEMIKDYLSWRGSIESANREMASE